MKKLYLCGPITGLNYDDATYGWRQKFSELADWKDLGIEVASPMRGKEQLKRDYDLSATGYEGTLMSYSKAIITRDRFDVRSSSLMVANLLGSQRISIGSVAEYAWADAWGVPVITVIEKDGTNPHEHAFIRELTGFRVDNLDDAAFISMTLLTGGIE